MVLPCVPATISTRRPFRKKCHSASGIERYGIDDASSATASGLPGTIALPTTTRSGAGERFAGENPVINPTREFLKSDAVGS